MLDVSTCELSDNNRPVADSCSGVTTFQQVDSLTNLDNELTILTQ
jgi:hypothetical protein